MLMKLEKAICPECGQATQGTVEQVRGLALFGEIDKNGFTHYGPEFGLENTHYISFLPARAFGRRL